MNNAIGRASWMRAIKARSPKEILPHSSEYCWSPFQRDYAQISHSDFFKRLSGKTQVHSFPINDHLRTRLTHSVEVSQIGKQISRYFCKKIHGSGLFNDNNHLHIEFSNKLEDITASACLLHDVGHPPFGHTGAHTLNSLANRYSEEFDDNKQVFRIALNQLWNEKFDPSAPLIAATMKKHDVSLVCYKSEAITLEAMLSELNLSGLRHPASYFMEAADDIAYIAADLADYLQYFIDEEKFRKLCNNEDIKTLQSITTLNSSFGKSSSNLYGLLIGIQNRSHEDIQEFSSNLIKCLLMQVFENIDHFFKSYTITNLDEIPLKLKDFTNANSYEKDPNLLYLNCSQNGKIFYQLKKKSYQDFILDQAYIGSQNLMAKRIITELFGSFEELIDSKFRKSDIFKIMPQDVKGYLLAAHDRQNPSTPARVVLDFMSGMTDGYALKTWEMIYRPHAFQRTG